MSMNCDIKNSDVLTEQLRCFEYSWCQELVDFKHDGQHSSKLFSALSNYYSSTSNEHKKLKISWKSLTTFLV